MFVPSLGNHFFFFFLLLLIFFFFLQFKACYPFTVITKYRLYSSCCTTHWWACITARSLYLPLPTPIPSPPSTGNHCCSLYLGVCFLCCYMHKFVVFFNFHPIFWDSWGEGSELTAVPLPHFFFLSDFPILSLLVVTESIWAAKRGSSIKKLRNPLLRSAYKDEEWGILEVEGDHLLHPSYLYRRHIFIVLKNQPDLSFQLCDSVTYEVWECRQFITSLCPQFLICKMGIIMVPAP